MRGFAHSESKGMLFTLFLCIGNTRASTKARVQGGNMQLDCMRQALRWLVLRLSYPRFILSFSLLGPRRSLAATVSNGQRAQLHLCFIGFGSTTPGLPSSDGATAAHERNSGGARHTLFHVPLRSHEQQAGRSQERGRRTSGQQWRAGHEQQQQQQQQQWRTSRRWQAQQEGVGSVPRQC